MIRLIECADELIGFDKREDCPYYIYGGECIGQCDRKFMSNYEHEDTECDYVLCPFSEEVMTFKEAQERLKKLEEDNDVKNHF